MEVVLSEKTYLSEPESKIIKSLVKNSLSEYLDNFIQIFWMKLYLCYQIDDSNFQREYSGLVEAMKFFQMKEGVIVTLNQKDVFEKDGYTVKLIPAHEFLI